MLASIGKLRRSFGTHSGTFHADDVSACAMLLYFGMIDRNKIIRTRDLGRLTTCDFVCDVGGIFDPSSRRFDHHQIEYTGHLSSAGMVLEYLRNEKVISLEVFNHLHRSLIHGIDQIDNGLSEPQFGFTSFSQVVSSFVPASYEATEAEQEEAFYEALDFVLAHLTRVMNKFDYMLGCKSKIKEIMDSMNECLVFEKAMPWLEAFFELGGEKHPAEFVIMPSGEHWKLRGIPPSYAKRMDVRRPLPKEWAGRLDHELKRETGIDGAIFCHKGRFVSVWESKEDALKALKIVLGKK